VRASRHATGNSTLWTCLREPVTHTADVFLERYPCLACRDAWRTYGDLRRGS
jgi:hypothetical protein